jgi:hypothetical protein
MENKNENTKPTCEHEWKLLDLGTGDYDCLYCEKCGQFKRDIEK